MLGEIVKATQQADTSLLFSVAFILGAAGNAQTKAVYSDGDRQDQQ